MFKVRTLLPRPEFEAEVQQLLDFAKPDEHRGTNELNQVVHQVPGWASQILTERIFFHLQDADPIRESIRILNNHIPEQTPIESHEDFLNRVFENDTKSFISLVKSAAGMVTKYGIFPGEEVAATATRNLEIIPACEALLNFITDSGHNVPYPLKTVLSLEGFKETDFVKFNDVLNQLVSNEFVEVSGSNKIDTFVKITSKGGLQVEHIKYNRGRIQLKDLEGPSAAAESLSQV